MTGIFRQTPLKPVKDDYALTLSKEGVLILSGVSARPWETGGDYTGTIQP